MRIRPACRTHGVVHMTCIGERVHHARDSFIDRASDTANPNGRDMKEVSVGGMTTRRHGNLRVAMLRGFDLASHGHDASRQPLPHENVVHRLRMERGGTHHSTQGSNPSAKISSGNGVQF